MEIAKLFAEKGPFATIYITQPPVERTAAQALLRWNYLRDRLGSAGAPEEVLLAADTALIQRGATPVRCLVVSASGVLLDRCVPSRTEMEDASWGPLPGLLPLLSFEQEMVPYVLVRIDRSGADVECYTDRLSLAREYSVEGTHDALRKVKTGGGWHHDHTQNRAEDSWMGNAKEVLEHLEATVVSSRPKMVLVSGDIRIAQKLEEHASPALRPLLQRLNGHGRTRDGGEQTLQSMVESAVETYAALSTREVLDRFVEERGQRDLAADGPEATIRALELSQVDTLLVSRTACGGEAVFGDSPNEVALDPSDLASMGVSSYTTAPLCDVAVRSAVMTGARIVVVDDPDLLTGGVGALLRFRLSS